MLCYVCSRDHVVKISYSIYTNQTSVNGSFLFYPANAWEEEDEVVLITCRLENPDLDMVSGNVKEKLENFSNEL